VRARLTVFAVGDVAALIAALGVRGVAPGADAVPVRVPAVVQLQAIGGARSPPEGPGGRSPGGPDWS